VLYVVFLMCCINCLLFQNNLCVSVFIQCLLREGWSTPKAPFVAALCTKGDVPPKTPKKAKASSKSKGMLILSINLLSKFVS